MPRWRRRLIVAFALIALALGPFVVTSGVLAYRFNRAVERDDVLAEASALPRITVRPEYTASPWSLVAPGAGSAQNLLILGVDTRKGWTAAESRSDTIMLVHLDADRTAATVVSFPRDSYVYVPPVPGKWSGGKTKINAAYAWGGAPLVVQVVSHLTGLSVDHVIRADFAAIRAVTDAVGGVEVRIDRTVRDGRTGFVFRAGRQVLDGRRAEIYVRQRYGLPDGDFDRVRRQQQYLRALAAKVTSPAVLANPLKLNSLIMTAGGALVIDQGLDLATMAGELSGLRADDLYFTTIPSDGFVSSASGTANRLSESGCAELFTALQTDEMAEYFTRHESFSGLTGR
ncbi:MULTISPECIES: LCP family protein [Actinoplanes]|uniref:LCP family protein n=1 Tax=Actinoplanes TaxID=1865 RepID=UPI0005F2FE78|nr:MULTISPECIES: LCP family protein [Actinoplanes]GLX99914.1 hypothetical protein Acsp01_02940 [Actinoplanes sp. NBRC 101535]